VSRGERVRVETDHSQIAYFEIMNANRSFNSDAMNISSLGFLTAQPIDLFRYQLTSLGFCTSKTVRWGQINVDTIIRAADNSMHRFHVFFPCVLGPSCSARKARKKITDASIRMWPANTSRMAEQPGGEPRGDLCVNLPAVPADPPEFLAGSKARSILPATL
jgi:hypothetical protein